MIERMREVFFKSGLSQTEFARRVKVTPAYIWRILNIDTVKPSERVVADICREFNVSEDWLRTGEGAMTVPTDRDALKEAFPLLPPTMKMFLLGYLEGLAEMAKRQNESTP